MVADVRGQGLFLGVELVDVDHPWLQFTAFGQPELEGQPSIGPLLCHRLIKRGYLVQVAGHDWHVVRMQPVLNISREKLSEFVAVCREEVEKLCELAVG